jgi:hypothetical protein
MVPYLKISTALKLHLEFRCTWKQIPCEFYVSISTVEKERKSEKERRRDIF